MAKQPVTVKSDVGTSGWVLGMYHAYLALVCGVTLVVAMISFGGILTTVVDMVLPPPSYISPTEYNPETKKEEPLSHERLAVRQAEETARQHHENTRSMANGLVYLLLGAGVFGYHWRLFRRK